MTKLYLVRHGQTEWHSNGETAGKTDIDLDDVNGNVDVELTNGRVNCDMIIPIDGSCDIDVMNGTIELDIPKSTSAILKANVVNGEVNVSGLTLRVTNQTTRRIEATIGDGKGTIDINVINGIVGIKGN